MTADEFTYAMQWYTPYTAYQSENGAYIYDIPSCKVLDFPGTDGVCYKGCQRTIVEWAAEKFHVVIEFKRQQKSCRCSLSPMN